MINLEQADNLRDQRPVAVGLGTGGSRSWRTSVFASESMPHHRRAIFGSEVAAGDHAVIIWPPAVRDGQGLNII